ncbi:Type 4 prepilin-like protein leader peptide-processing enzyme [Bacillus sonorensis]|nr:Type 4 prepilin-like protein leader peptide-processing enzyme [Bacillus sonorensis]GIN66698.1 type 4 prepilin-like proteins leader peptide-processing enzyme [Bacillus sonorensis]
MMYLFIFGLVLGSFFNVAGRRIPENTSLIAPRSACPDCCRPLTFLELIPVLSYILQRGKCRGCKRPVSIVYPAVELAAALLFAFAYLRIGDPGELVIALFLISLLLIVFVSDVMYMVIPDAVLCFFLPVFAAGRILFPLEPWHSSLTGAIAGCLLPLVAAVMTKGGIGGGDVKLFAVLGIVLGVRQILLVFVLSAAAGMVMGFAAMLAGKLKRREPLPFAPAILIGTLTGYFYGDPLIGLYIQMI